MARRRSEELSEIGRLFRAKLQSYASRSALERRQRSATYRRLSNASPSRPSSRRRAMTTCLGRARWHSSWVCTRRR
jgi:hypothetical protein